MKKILSKISIFFFCFLFVFVSFPFYSFAQTSNSIANPWDNTIDFLRCQLGVLNAEAGSIAGVSRLEFYNLLYDLPLIYNGSQFTPSSIFTSSEWVDACNSSSASVNGKSFNILDCLAESNILVPNSSGDYTVSPDLLLRDHGGSSGSFDSANPLDGIKVYTNFSTNFDYSTSAKPSYYETLTNDIKSQYINNFDNVVFFGGFGSQNHNSTINKLNFKYYSFDLSNVDYYFFINSYDNSLNYKTAVSPRLHLHYTPSDTWYQSTNNSSIYNKCSSYFITPTSTTGSESYFYNTSASGLLNYVSSSDFESSTIVSSGTSFTDDIFDGFMYSNRPVVFATSFANGKSYYYWLHNAPSGYYYTTTNVNNTVFSSDYVNNTNWEETYNNYVTDVSNYYSTTENITNEQLTQYIDKSTTITNITNNYITNNNGGGSGEDDVITNSWLERIYQKLVEIKSILLGQGDPDDNSDYITDNGIKNDILNYPASDLFPDVPVEDFISDADDFTLDLFASKISAVISEAIPFCYMHLLGDIADTIKASPVAPYWEIPFQIDRIGIDENLVLDLTSSDWDNVHTVWITLFMILFISYLFYLSYRIVLLVSNLFA